MEADVLEIPAILYAAKSTPDEKDSNVSQLEECRRRAIDELGRRLVSEHHEANKSGWKGDRGDELEAALRAAEAAAEKFGHAELWVWKSERLARGSGRKNEARSLLEVYTRCKRAGVTLRSVKDDEYVQNDMLIGAASQMAEKYSADLSVNVARGMRERAAKGLFSGPCPYGYVYVKDEDPRIGSRLVPDPAEAAIVVRIFSEYVSGSSLSEIARGLYRDRVPTKKGAKKGSTWRQGTVSGIVRNPVYIGKITYRKETLPGEHEPIVDPDLWDRAAKLVAAMPSRPGRPTLRKRHLFTAGFLRCGSCGAAMGPRTRSKEGYEYYECEGRKIAGCRVGAVRRADIDNAVFAHFEQTRLDLEASREALVAAMDRRASEAHTLLEGAEREAQHAAARLERVKRDYTHGELTAAEWRALRSELEPEAEAAHAEAERLREQLATIKDGAGLADAEAEVIDSLAQIRAAVAGEIAEADDAASMQAILRRLFDRFIFHPEAPPERAQTHVELINADFWIEPIPSEHVVADYEEKLKPIFRGPHENAENNYPIGSPLR